MKFDLHMHTNYSKDCKMEPSTIVNYAMKLGLDGIAVTDHETIKGGLAVKKIAPKELDIIVGSEIKTDRGEVIGYFIEDEIPGGTLYDVVDQIKNQNGLAIAPHPFDLFRPNSLLPTDEDSKILDGLEVFNSRCMLHKTNKSAEKFAKKYGLITTAGSDAHTLDEIGNSGVEVDDIEDIRKNRRIRIFGKKMSMTKLLKTKMKRFI